jgi:hypothetical protein
MSACMGSSIGGGGVMPAERAGRHQRLGGLGVVRDQHLREPSHLGFCDFCSAICEDWISKRSLAAAFML